MNYLWIFKVNHHRSLFPWVDYTHIRWVNSNHSYLARSCTCIHCSLGNSSRHVQEWVWSEAGKFFDTRKNGWKVFKYSSLFLEVAANPLYFSIILSLPSCPLRLSLGSRSNFWWNLVISFLWKNLWLVCHIFGMCIWLCGWVQHPVN
jgi:hypothetical protein